MELAAKFLDGISTAQNAATALLVLVGIVAMVAVYHRGEKDSKKVHELYDAALLSQKAATEAQLAAAKGLESLVDEVRELRRDISPRRRS